MPKWIAIRASAVLALAASLATLCFSVAGASALLFSPMRYSGPLPPNLVKAFGTVMAAFLAGAGFWGIAVAVGIFRRRNWARVSMVVFGGLLAFFGGTGALAMLLVPFPMNPDLNQRIVSIARASMVAFYLLMALVGAWWLIVFNRQSGKRYFAEGGAATESARPLSIGVIGWYLMVAAVGTALCGVFRIPTILFGFVVAGWTTLAVCTVLTAIQLYLGAGLLQLDESARVWTIVYLSAMGANGLATVAAPGYPARMRAFAGEFQKFFHMDMPLLPNAWLLGTASVAYVAILIWFLVRRRAAFAGRG
jgi:hypothetical protein